jgi:uncharacterized protein
MMKLSTFFSFLKPHVKRENKKRHGFYRLNSRKGGLEAEGNYFEGVRVGTWCTYYAGGALAIEESFDNGKRQGAYKSYFENGALMSEGQYHRNKRHGRFNIYNDKGLVVRTMTFEANKLIREEANPDHEVKPAFG